METFIFTKNHLDQFTGQIDKEIASQKLMIEQFSELRSKNEKELGLILTDADLEDEEILKKIEVMQTLNHTLDEAIDECLDSIIRSKIRLENLNLVVQEN